MPPPHLPESARLYVRPAVLADLDDIVEIERASFDAPWPRSGFRDELACTNSAARIAVAVRDGEIAGFMNYWHVDDERHVLNFAVHPKHRRCGVGRALLDYLHEVARADDVHLLMLEVRVSNTAARELYRGAGFFDFDVRKHYYSDNGEDAVVMLCVLRDLDIG
ncbi:MAG: ribosomal protein S18-alanine N-acetyltransferase [Proteobacteria bacterium]|nr:ribosomal protein S18-alanine N-acetyltransferase [Pseudomonadota bacterium]